MENRDRIRKQALSIVQNGEGATVSELCRILEENENLKKRISRLLDIVEIVETLEN